MFLLLPSFAFAADINPNVNRSDSPGNYIKKNIKDRLDGTYADTLNVESNFSYSQMTSTTNIKTSPGFLHSIVVCSTQTGVSFTVYDSTSVNVTTPVIAVFTAPVNGGEYTLDVQALNGIQVNMPDSGPNITVSYR